MIMIWSVDFGNKRRKCKEMYRRICNGVVFNREECKLIAITGQTIPKFALYSSMFITDLIRRIRFSAHGIKCDGRL